MSDSLFATPKRQSSQTMHTTPIILKLNKKSAGVSETPAPSFSYKLFRHFEQYKRDYSVIETYALDNPKVHHSFIKLGIQCVHGKLSGSNMRCLALLNALKDFVNDYKATSNEKKTISKDIERKLRINIKLVFFVSVRSEHQVLCRGSLHMMHCNEEGIRLTTLCLFVVLFIFQFHIILSHIVHRHGKCHQGYQAYHFTLTSRRDRVLSNLLLHENGRTKFYMLDG
jgi:hypothetical protein